MYKKFKKLKLQGSNDGVNWFDITPFEYKRGDVIEEDSKDCGGYGGVTQNRWVEILGEYLCINNDKYKKLKKQYLDTATGNWVDVEPLETMQGELIEKNSEQCGYAVQWVDTDDWGCKAIEEPTQPDTPTKTTYDVYVVNEGNGTYTINSDATIQPYVYSYGSQVIIHAIPNDGYSFSKFMYGSTIDYGRVEYNSYFNITVMSSTPAWYSVYVKVVFAGGQPTPIEPIITDDVSFQNALNYNGSVLTYFYSDGTFASEALPPSTYKRISNASYIIDFGASLYSLSALGDGSKVYMAKAVYLPGTEIINGWVFAEDKVKPRLQSVYLPNCSYIAGGVFTSCSKLTDIYLNRNRVVEIGYASSGYPYAVPFYYCGSSFKIHVPSSLYSIYISRYSNITYNYSYPKSDNPLYYLPLVDRFVSDL